MMPPLTSSLEDAGSVAVELPPTRERMAVVALAIAAFGLNLNTNVLGALLPFLPGDLVHPGSGDAWLLASAALASAIGALVVGPMADRMGRRVMLLVGMLVFAIGSALHLVVDSYAMLLVARAVSGAGVGFAYAPASALVAEIVPYERRGAAMGAFTAGMFLALPIGLPLAWWFAKHDLWRWIFLVQAAIALVGAGLAFRSVPAIPGATRWVDPRDVVLRVPVVAALLAVMLHVGSFFTTVQLAGRWLDEAQLVVKADQGLLWIVLGFAAAVGSLAFGQVADRVGKRNFVLLTSVVLVLCFGTLVRVHSLAGLLPIGLALAVTAAARTGPLQALTSGLVPSYQLGTLMGLRAFAMQLGVFLFAQCVPTDSSMGFSLVLYAAAGCQLVSYVVIRFGVREGRS